MLTLPNLLAQLQKKGVSLNLSEGRLQYHVSAGKLSAGDKDLIRARREDIIRLMRAQAAAVRPPLMPSGSIAPSLNQRLWWKWVTMGDRPPPPQLIPVVRKFRGIAPDDVEQGIREIVRRHAVLRSRFCIKDGELAVALNDADNFRIEIEQADSDQDIAGKVKTFTGRAMAVSDPWLTRAMLIVAADGEVVAVLSINHMIFDGPSFFLLDSELDKIGGPQTGSGSAPAIGFFDYAKWDRDWFAARGSDLVDYWRHWSQNIPILLAPGLGAPVIWRPGPRLTGTFLMPPQVAPRVRGLAAALSTSPFLIYLTVFAMTIARWSGQARFGLRNVGDARLEPELSSVMGYMTMTDPIEVNIDKAESFAANLKRIERDFLAALQLRLPSLHAFLPYVIEPDAPETVNNLAVLINYHPPKPGAPTALDAPAEEGPWPPSVKQHEALDWPHPVPAIVLDIMDQEEGPGIVGGMFRLNGALLSQEDRDTLVATFFATFSEQILQA